MISGLSSVVSGFIGRFQSILIALVIGIAVGTGGTLYLKSKFEAADKTETLVEARKDDVRSIEESQSKEKEIQEELDKTRANFEAYRKKFGQHVLVKTKAPICDKENPSATTVAQTPISSDDVYLTVGDVRMLNNIRANINSGSTSLSDEESRAASTVTVRDLVASDAEVSRLYNELAIRHNALVEYVEAQVKRFNAKILGTE